LPWRPNPDTTAGTAAGRRNALGLAGDGLRTTHRQTGEAAAAGVREGDSVPENDTLAGK
jgi:hypothetical protein